MGKQLSILFLSLLLLTSCLEENTEGCLSGKLGISLKYTINMEDEDRLDEEIGQVILYVFDDVSGVLIRIIPISHDQLVRGVYFTDLDPGSYTFVAWAVDGVDLHQGGYEVVEMTDFATDTYTTPTVGVTIIDNFRVRLQTITSGANKIPANEQFNELYHAKAENIAVTEDELTIFFNFIKNTNLVKVRVVGLQNLSPTRSTTPEVKIVAIGTDDRYNILNAAGTPAAPLLYPYPTTYPEATEALSDIHLLRLDKELHKTHPIQLHLLNKVTGEPLIEAIDLLEVILKIKDKDGALIFKTQQDLDRWDEFPILIKIGVDLSVNVGMEGFEIEDTEGEI